MSSAQKSNTRSFRRDGIERLTHFDAEGSARMVDVSGKPETMRRAVASGRVVMQPETLMMIRDQGEDRGSELAKGDVLGVARLAGIMAAKRTSDLIPLCHPLPLDSVDLNLTCQGVDKVLIEAQVRTIGRTGVEMEALTAVSVAALAVYDMCKAVDKSMFIRDVRLVEKRGGTSGDYVATESEA